MLSSEHCHSFFVEENPQNVAAVFKAVPTHCPAPEQFPAPTCQGPKGRCWQLSKHPRGFFLVIFLRPCFSRGSFASTDAAFRDSISTTPRGYLDQSSVLRVWSKVRWRFNSKVPTQSIFRLIFLIMKSLPFIIHPIYTDRMFRVIARKKCDFSKRKKSGKSQILEKYHPCKGK